MATYEGKWRCPRCSQKNRGRDLNCQTCGVKRSEDVEFFLEDDTAAIEDENLLRRANAGADWICRYCNGNNPNNAVQCSSCGNTRSDQDRQLVEETRDVGDWAEKAGHEARFPAAPVAVPVAAVAPRASFFKSGVFKILLLGAGGLMIVFVALAAVLVYLSTLTYATEIEVTGLEWSRTIKLEEYRTVAEKAWEGELPPNARVQSQSRELHHTDKIPDGSRSVPETYTEQVSDGTERYVCGQTSKKNGFFEDKYCTRTKYKSVTKTRTHSETVYRDVPVYKMRYSYLIDKWVSAGDKTLDGTDFNPQWAKVLIDAKHREAGRTESYNLICKELGGDNKIHKTKLTADNWSKFKAGARLHGKTNFFGKLVSIDEMPDASW